MKPALRRNLIAEIEKQMQPTPRWLVALRAGWPLGEVAKLVAWQHAPRQEDEQPSGEQGDGEVPF